MELLGVRVEIMANLPVLFLRERAGLRRLLPIYIGSPEASSIQWGSEGIEPPRPLTHDLIVNLFGALGAVLDRVVITDVKEGTFFAELHLNTRTGSVVVSSRPSDAIAIAVRCGCSIFCDPDVLTQAGKIATIEDEPETSQDIDPEQVLTSNLADDDLLGEFRDFIENINPDDFQA